MLRRFNSTVSSIGLFMKKAEMQDGDIKYILYKDLLSKKRKMKVKRVNLSKSKRPVCRIETLTSSNNHVL